MAYTKRNILLANLGLNTSAPAEYIDDRSSPSGENVSINRNVLHKRVGTTAAGTTAGEELLWVGELLRDTTRYIVRIGLTKIDIYTQSTNTWSDICPSTNSFVVGATNNKLNFNIGASELTATVASGTYTMGVIQTAAGTLCKAIYDAIHAAEAAGTYTVTHNGSNVIITRSAGTLQLLWKTGTNGSDNTDTHIGTLIGFTDTADDTGALTYTADSIVYHPLTGTTADAFSVAAPILSGQRVLVMSNFIDNIRKYTGTGNTADLGGSPPKAKFMVAYSAYLVLAHVSDGTKYRMRVQWSNTDDIEDWSTGNAGSKDLLEDGNDITGLNIFGNYLCVHKESSIYLGYLVTTSDVIQFDRRNTGVGTICNNTIQNIGENSQIFLARDGIRIFNGTSAPLIESQVTDEIRETLNSEYIHKCWSIVVPELNEYWVGVPIGSQTTPDTVYKYNYLTGQCYKDIRANITACGKYQKTSDITWDNDLATWQEATSRWDDISLSSLASTAIFGGNTGITTVMDTTVNNDNSAAITAFRDTKDFEADEKGRFVRWTGMEIFAKGNGLTLYYSTNSGLNWNLIDTFSLSSDYPSDDSPVMAYFDVLSTKIRFRFENKTASETFYLKDFIIQYISRESRK